ncbi:alpha/beta fold hydrolase [Patescibacteria group bacterium]|nr:alpha/beta fold hydrolase [Patescibacteria group bacterium]
MEKLSLKNRKGQNIVGLLEKPNSEVKGTVIVLHGYGGFKEQPHIQAMKQAFMDNGFISFNFDATNTFGESDGEYEKATIGLHYEDFEDVANWVQEQEWFQSPLAVVGHSMGGYAVARYAEDYPNKVGLCAPIAPVVSGDLSWEAHRKAHPGELEEWKKTGWVESASASIPGVIKRQPWSHMEERLDHNLIPDAGKLTMPVFLYVGSEDDGIPPEHVQILFDAIPIGNKTLVIADGAPHTYRTEKDIQHLYHSLSEWIKKQIN